MPTVRDEAKRTVAAVSIEHVSGTMVRVFPEDRGYGVIRNQMSVECGPADL